MKKIPHIRLDYADTGIRNFHSQVEQDEIMYKYVNHNPRFDKPIQMPIFDYFTTWRKLNNFVAPYAGITSGYFISNNVQTVLEDFTIFGGAYYPLRYKKGSKYYEDYKYLYFDKYITEDDLDMTATEFMEVTYTKEEKYKFEPTGNIVKFKNEEELYDKREAEGEKEGDVLKSYQLEKVVFRTDIMHLDFFIFYFDFNRYIFISPKLLGRLKELNLDDGLNYRDMPCDFWVK